MPIYDFICKGCGPFEEWRSFAEASDLMVCPSCGEEARRIYSMPATKRIPTALSDAMNRAEKSAHEPEVVRQPTSGTFPGKKYQPSQGGHHGHNH